MKTTSTALASFSVYSFSVKACLSPPIRPHPHRVMVQCTRSCRLMDHLVQEVDGISSRPPRFGETSTASPSPPATAVTGPPPPPAAAAAATAASMQGALAGWMMMSEPSRTESEWGENTMRGEVPGEEKGHLVLGLFALMTILLSVLGNGHHVGCSCFTKSICVLFSTDLFFSPRDSMMFL